MATTILETPEMPFMTNRYAAIVLLLSVSVASEIALADDHSDVRTLSGESVKKTCKAAAKKDGFSVGDFGDVKFDSRNNVWITKMNLQGKAERIKARCEWDGRGAPVLFAWGTRHDVAALKYTKVDVTRACKAQGQAQGMEIGDFGDTDYDEKTGLWVSRMMVKRAGGKKHKGTCRWDGRRDPVIE